MRNGTSPAGPYPARPAEDEPDRPRQQHATSVCLARPVGQRAPHEAHRDRDQGQAQQDDIRRSIADPRAFVVTTLMTTMTVLTASL